MKKVNILYVSKLIKYISVYLEYIFLSLIISFTLLTLSASAYEIENTTKETEVIYNSFLYQRSFIKNVYFKAYCVQPHFKAESYSEGLIKRELPTNSQTSSILEQEYKLSKDGKFLMTINQYISDSKIQSVDTKTIEKLTKEMGARHISFNGELYYSYAENESGATGGIGSIFAPENPFDYTEPMIKPTYFMDQVYNDDILQIIKEGKDITITEKSDSMWKIEYKDPDSEQFYDLELDPSRDFIITKMSGYWNRGQVFEKNMTYGSTEEGFYYLKRGVLSINNEIKSIMEIGEFELNGPEDNYTLEIPIGTRVTDHTKGIPAIYYQGQPGKTSEETGDISIYSLTDSIDRVALEGLEDIKDKGIEEIKPQIQEIEPSFINYKSNTPNETNITGTNIKNDNRKIVMESAKFRFVVIIVAIFLMISGVYVLFIYKRGGKV
ncbi:MAG: hypothetical protein JXB49_33035 [Bacteroidales bacterium]|nr:hypothetical protein [Bacteroidales bacterium]